MRIQCQDLCLSFGSTQAINELSTTMDGQHIIGLLGQNGCGKTSLLHSMAGLLPPTSGSCRVFGKEATELSRVDYSQFGVVHQECGFIDSMTTQSHLNYIASFYSSWDKDREQRLMKDFELDPKARVGRLSQGNKQKLGIILAVCHRPKLLLLDEPANALDPIVRKELLRLLFQLVHDDGATIVVSSHVLMDVEKVIDHVWFMRHGELFVDQSLDALLESYAQWDITPQEGQALPTQFDESFILQQSVEGRRRRLIVKADEGQRASFMAERRVLATPQSINLEGLFPILARS